MKKQFKSLPCLLMIWLVFLLIGCQQQDATIQMRSQVDKLVVFWNTGNFDGIEDVLSPDFEMRLSPDFAAKKGIDAFKQSVFRTRQSYPDFTITVLEYILSDAVGAGKWNIKATSKTGKKLDVMGMSILHFTDGKIKDEWISNNDLLWLEQLGYEINPPAPPVEE